MKSLNWSKLSQFLTNNWQAKLISVVLAIGIWFFVNTLETEEQTLNLPISFINLPPNMMILEKSDNSAIMVVKASRGFLKDNISLVKLLTPIVDLTNARVGEYNYKIEVVQSNNTEQQIRYTLIKKYVTLKIDHVENKIVPVKPRTIGSVKEGYVVEGISINQTNVVLKGPAQLLETISFIETSPIDITGLSSNIVVKVSLKLPPLVKTMQNGIYTVTIEINEKRENKEGLFPIKLINLQKGLKPLYPPEIFLVLNIPGRYSYNYKDKVSITLDCQKVTGPGTYLLRLNVKKPSDIYLVNKIEYYNLQVINE